MSCIVPSPPSCSQRPSCPDKFGCIAGQCPDFQIKRNDTRPPLKISIQDENGSIDLNGLVLEASMWAVGKLKKNITADDDSICLADNIGFCQALPNDIIVIERIRDAEHMRVTGFDEDNFLIFVERGVDGTISGDYKKGTGITIFRFKDSPAVTEMVVEDIDQLDGTTLCDQLAESILVYEWDANDTCVPGCFRFEFKLIKMSSDTTVPSVIPICFSGVGVEWVRRFPQCGEFIVEICNSPTSEVPLQIPSVTPL